LYYIYDVVCIICVKNVTKSMKMGFMMRIHSKLTHEISKNPKNGFF